MSSQQTTPTTPTPQIRFEDGAGYERMMGTWSRLAGEVFLDWVSPPAGLRWVDVGCGNGAFTQLIVDRCMPSQVQGIDPSEGQLAFARTRPASQKAQFQIGDAMALPFADDSFDAAVMALVLFFVPEPARGVAEMARVVKPGGLVTAYTWDVLDGGFPLNDLQVQMRERGMAPLLPPSAEASRFPVMIALWEQAGLRDIETRAITVQRSFAGFDEYWDIAMLGTSVSATLKALPADEHAALKAGVKARMAPQADGRITLSARANAIMGRVTG